ncbi:MAG: serine/threonine protein kinase [Acidobacteria bacterium]|nr:serine/threonine protein kinase [Acidobacteriota bacterium]
MGLKTGETIGDYQVLGLLGRGGMGSVYKVRNVISERYEAMKVLLPDLEIAPDLAERFMREIKTLASLQHPHIASLHTALRHENQLLMVMEFVEGSSLEVLLASKSLTLGDGIQYLQQVLSALDYAHARGVIHRDIKPANIMVTPQGNVKLLDFGIASTAGRARLTQSGAVIGSAHYVSPEQIRSSGVDQRSDLYSTGITLYELAVGRRPFEGDHAYAIMCAQLEQQPAAACVVNPDVPPLLSGLIDKALEKAPEMRFQTANEFHDALAMFVSSMSKAVSSTVLHTQVSASRATPAPEAPRTPVPTGSTVKAEDLEALKKNLAAYIGPMARVLVTRAAKSGATLEQLYITLAQEIPSEKDRSTFLGSTRSQK